MTARDHDLSFLLSLDGLEFQFAPGFAVKIEARAVAATRHRPHGVKYSLTLHDPAGRRLYGIDMPTAFAGSRNTTTGTFTAPARCEAMSIAGRRRCWTTSTARSSAS